MVNKTLTLGCNRSRTLNGHWNVIILGLSLTLFIATLVGAAWLCDDAYITLRTIDNLINGYGLTWNPIERVQAFTHPLWMLILATFYAITHEAYYTTIFVSLALSIAVIALIVFRIATRWIAAVLAVASLTLSKSFIDFSTSGLENPLTHLILVVWFAVFLEDGSRRKKLLILSLIAACAALNRLDTIVILLPPLMLAVFDTYRSVKDSWLRQLILLLISFSPLGLWELFSLFYYGFLFPNTYYAKLHTGIPQADLVRSGISYLLQSSRLDPLVPLLIGYALIVTAWERTKHSLAISLGILLYIFYVVMIGGDFMSGRFLTIVYLCDLIILIRSSLLHKHPKLFWLWMVLLAVGLISPSAPIYGEKSLQCDIASTTPTDVSDERGCYFAQTGLVKQRRDSPIIPNHSWAHAGLSARKDFVPISIMRGIGMFGYFAGPNEYVVDPNALANPLLARLPVPKEKKWRIGHFERLIPGGYLETLISGQNKICNQDLARYYDKLSLITRAPLLDPERLKAIWEINTGRLDHLPRAYTAVATTDQALLCNAQATSNIVFDGGPTLRGYAVSSREVSPGSQLTIILYWQSQTEIKTPFYSFVHIRNSQPNGPINPRSSNEIWAQAEHAEPGGCLTIDYWPPQIYADLFVLMIPADMPPGEYFLEVGWFDPQTGEQLEPDPATVKPPLRILWRSVLLPSVQVR